MWQMTLASNLAGIESRLPEPFDKSRARAVPVSAELALGPDGVHDFVVEGRSLEVHGQVRAGVTSARFEVQGVVGSLRRAASEPAPPEITLDVLDMKRAPAVLAAAGALMPIDGEVNLTVADLRTGDNSLGALRAALARHDAGLRFSLESGVSEHRLSARGECLGEGRCRVEFSADTPNLAALLRGAQLPSDWPLNTLHVAGSLDWPAAAGTDIARTLSGTFDLATQGADREHQLTAVATVVDGQILLTDLQGTGPAPDQVFRGNGRIGLVARDYDVTVDYERVALAATAVPSPARARLARAWNAVRGSVVRRGWSEAPETKRVQWHGTWD
jgi:hypothetical protein